MTKQRSCTFWIGRLAKCVIYLTCFSLFIWTLINQLMEFATKKTTLSSTFVKKNEMRHPAITICPSLAFKEDKKLAFRLQDYLENTFSLDEIVHRQSWRTPGNWTFHVKSNQVGMTRHYLIFNLLCYF